MVEPVAPRDYKAETGLYCTRKFELGLELRKTLALVDKAILCAQHLSLKFGVLSAFTGCKI